MKKIENLCVCNYNGVVTDWIATNLCFQTLAGGNRVGIIGGKQSV